MFTKEQIEAYLKDPTRCPFCGSDDISGNGMWQGLCEEMICDYCGREWSNLYDLVSIFEKE